MLEGLTPLTPKKTCRVKMIADQLDDSDKTILMDAVESPTVWSPTALEKALWDREVKLPRYHIEKHRARDCSCSKI
jgi:hypothetical protein